MPTRKTLLQVLGAMALPYVGIALVIGGLLALGLFERVMGGGYAARMLANAGAGALILLMLLPYAALAGGVPLHGFGFGWGRRDGAALTLGAVVTFGLAWAFISGLGLLGVREVSPVAPAWAMVAVALIGHAGTFFEEVLFRGYVLTRLRRVGVGWAILISAVLFSVGHIPMRGVSHLVISWLLGGLVYGYLYLKSGSLWVAGGFHLAHNVAADLFLYSDNGVALVQFSGALGPAEKLGFELLLSAAVALLTALLYGRGTGLLDPAPRLAERWARLDALALHTGGASQPGIPRASSR